jgi:hypothetical protein
MAKDDLDRTKDKIFGNIDPNPGTRDHLGDADADPDQDQEEDVESMHGGSQQGESTHAGSRDVTEGVTGGTGTETGGTRNMRQGSGATGGDIGNRPEVYKPK